MNNDNARFTWELAAYLRAQTYLTHAQRDEIGKAFRAGWEARSKPDPTGAHRADKKDNRP